MIHRTQTLLYRLVLLGLLPLSNIALGETMYVDDTLTINLRSGPELKYRILKSISSGEKVQVIERNRKTQWAKVQEPGGVQGWVPSRFLRSDPIAKERLAAALERLSLLEDKEGSLIKEFDRLKEENQQLKQKTESLTAENAEISKKLREITEISENAVHLDNRNRELQQENQVLENDIDVLQADNLRLKERTETDFMLIGGGLVALGVFIAFVIPWMKPTKKNDSW